jgi:hypothetical protein
MWKSLLDLLVFFFQTCILQPQKSFKAISPSEKNMFNFWLKKLLDLMQMILRRDVGTDLNLAKLKTIPKLCKKMSMPQEKTWIYAMLVTN